jgi:hypothetical protein
MIANDPRVASEEKIKQELQESMERQLAILRNILASFHQEQAALMQENYLALRGIVEDRLHFIEVFQEWNGRFLKSMEMLSEKSKTTKPAVVDDAFAAALEQLRSSLKPDDVELLLLNGQLRDILGEIQRETGNLLHFVEHPPALNECYLQKLPLPHLAPVALALIEQGQEESSL